MPWTVVAPVADGVYTGPPSPAYLLGRPELAAAPRLVPDASLVVVYTLTGGPFGTVHHWLRYDSGKPVAGRASERLTLTSASGFTTA